MKTILRSLGFVLSLLPAFAHANLLVNGDFESPVIGSGSWTILQGNALTGWSADPNGVELRNNIAGAAYSSSQYVELDTTANSLIKQSIQTTIGQNYPFSFAYAPREGVSAASNLINVFWDGSLLASITGDGTHNAGNVWQTYNFNVLALSATSIVSFAADGISESYGGSLDTVSVSTLTVPEPGMLALLGFGSPVSASAVASALTDPRSANSCITGKTKTGAAAPVFVLQGGDLDSPFMRNAHAQGLISDCKTAIRRSRSP